MTQFYPTAGLHIASMESQAKQAERQARIDSLLEEAALARRRSQPPAQNLLLYRLSLKLMALGARLVQFGLPPYEPSPSRVALASN